jgi:hypothetical protein
MSDLELKWRPIDLTADRPLARGGHASAVVTHGGTPHLYIIGGADPFGAVTGAVTVVNLDSSAAHPAAVAHGSDRMSPRCSHSCVAVTSSVDGGEGPHILVYGGVAYDPVQTVFDDMWGITIDKADPLTSTWTRLTATGDAPGRRHSFASACLESRWIIACGVTGDEPTGPECTGYTNAVHQLNIATREWTRVQVDIGREREMAAAASLGPTEILLSGGRAVDFTTPEPQPLLYSRLLRIKFSETGSTVTVVAEDVALCSLAHSLIARRIAIGDAKEGDRITMLAVGGQKAPSDEYPLGLTNSDVVFRSSDGVAMVERRDTAGRDVHFGLGHSLASLGDRHFVVDGLRPNAVGVSLLVFDLLGW